MKAITIIQPWATLIAMGEKKYETRSWATKYRGPIAIHAGKRVDKEACEREPIKPTLVKHGYTADNLPTGAIVATSILSECFAVKRDVLGGLVLLESPHSRKFLETLDDEYKFGDFTSGRYAWELANVRQIEPIPAQGRLGLWTYSGAIK